MTPPLDRSGPLRTAAGLAYAVMHARRGGMVRPTDHTVVRSGPGDVPARRVLLVGNGLAHGWGVGSHRSAPTGLLAAAVAERLGLPCEVEFVGDAAMTIETAALWLEGRADTSFHGAVVAIGSNDALRLTPTDQWEWRLHEVLSTLRRCLPEGAPVLVLGVPHLYAAATVRRMHPVFRARARRLDAVTRRVVAEQPDTTFLPAADLRTHVGAAPGPVLYGAFAESIADAVCSATAAVPRVDPAREEAFQHDEVRTLVEAARDDALQTLQDVVIRAKARFGVMESAVTLVDGDRTWHVAHSGVSPMQAPRPLTVCPVVTEGDQAVVIEDLTRDGRFAGNPFLELQHAQFYAGAPVHASDGTAIGALCLFHAFPRSSDRVDLDDLRAFAAEAEAAIRGVVDARALAEQQPLGR